MRIRANCLPVLFFLAFAAASCSKSGSTSPVSEGTLLVKTVAHSELGDNTREFTYDSTYRLQSVTYSTNQSPYSYCRSVTYDSIGRLRECTETQIDARNGAQRITLILDFRYGPANRSVHRQIRYSYYPSGYYDRGTALDADGTPVADTVYKQSSDSISWYRTLNWDGRGNVVRTDVTLFMESGMIDHDDWEMTYGNELSPFNGRLQRLVYFLVTDGEDVLMNVNCKNGLLRRGQPVGAMGEYTFNAAGLPVRSVYRPVSNPTSTSVWEYYYAATGLPK